MLQEVPKTPLAIRLETLAEKIGEVRGKKKSLFCTD